MRWINNLHLLWHWMDTWAACWRHNLWWLHADKSPFPADTKKGETHSNWACTHFFFVCLSCDYKPFLIYQQLKQVKKELRWDDEIRLDELLLDPAREALEYVSDLAVLLVGVQLRLTDVVLQARFKELNYVGWRVGEYRLQLVASVLTKLQTFIVDLKKNQMLKSCKKFFSLKHQIIKFLSQNLNNIEKKIFFKNYR